MKVWVLFWYGDLIALGDEMVMRNMGDKLAVEHFGPGQYHTNSQPGFCAWYREEEANPRDPYPICTHIWRMNDMSAAEARLRILKDSHNER